MLHLWDEKGPSFFTRASLGFTSEDFHELSGPFQDFRGSREALQGLDTSTDCIFLEPGTSGGSQGPEGEQFFPEWIKTYKTVDLIRKSTKIVESICLPIRPRHKDR